jgi:IS1 family transposase
MAGRPAAAVTIVPHANVMNLQGVLQEVWNFANLIPCVQSNRASMEWLACRRLLRNELRCAGCNLQCRLHAHADNIDGYRWKCPACAARKSVRDGSFFTGSHLTLQQIVIVVYCWSRDMPQKDIMREADIDKKTTIDWCNFLREECETCLINNPEEIGGIDANGDAMEVEIDESKFFHRKYHRGLWRQGHWVFGGVERLTGHCFLLEVPDRRAATLENLVEQFILPGTHIISDGWAAYANLDQIAHGVYTHSVVVHQRNFVDPNDPTVHTNLVENMWMRAKRKLRRQFGTSEELFPSYLHEFQFRNRFRDDDAFGRILCTIATNYPVA